jgi:adenylate kinase family enzyme
MKRILVIGSSGAGKSTFSRRLGEITDIEVIHLDKLHWRAGWVEPSKIEWRKMVEDNLKKEAWIMDGNYSGTLALRLEKCDTVIFLDIPHTVCAWRVLKRFFLYRKRSRPDMAEGCVEKFDWKFVKWTWNYPKRSKPRVEELLKQFQNSITITRLKSNKEVKNFLVNYD